MVRMMLVLVCVAMFAGSCAAAEEPRSLLTRRLATAVETGAEFTLLHNGMAMIQNDITRVKSLPANYLLVSESLRKSKSCLMDVKAIIKVAEVAAQAISWYAPAKPFAMAAKKVLQLANDAVARQDKMVAEPADKREGPWNKGFLYVYEGGATSKIMTAVAAVDKKLATLETSMKVASTAAQATGLAFTNVAKVAAMAGKDATSALKHVDNTATSMYAVADKMEKIVSNANAAYTKEFETMEPFIKGVADAAAVVLKYEQAACIMVEPVTVIKKLLEPIVKAMATKLSIPCICNPATKCKQVCTPLGCKCLGGIKSTCPLQPAQCQKFGDILAQASAQDILDGAANAVALLEDKAKDLLKPLTDKLANVMPKLPFPAELKMPTIDTSGLTAFADSALVDMNALNEWASVAKVGELTEESIVTALKGCSIPFLIQPSWDPECDNGGVPSPHGGGGLATPEEFIQLKAQVTALGLKADGEVVTSGAAEGEAEAAAAKAAADAAKALEDKVKIPDNMVGNSATGTHGAPALVLALVGVAVGVAALE